MAPPTTVLTIVKRMTYRDVSGEEWSNTYALSGSTPADSTAWRALFDALVAQEKTLYRGSSTVVRGYAYDKIPVKGDHAIWSVNMTVSPNTPVPGTLATGSSSPMPGDVAVWVRWKLDRLSSKGKPVYLRKYFHDGNLHPSVKDQIDSAYLSALTAFGGKMRDGTFLDARVITDHLGTAVLGAGSTAYCTTRTLKRRGKRPPTPT